MKLLNFLKKKKEVPKRPVLSKVHQMAKASAIFSHKNRVSNLNDEFKQLSLDLESIESDFDTPRTKKQKNTDTIIRRMSILKYEIEIREGLIKWLS